MNTIQGVDLFAGAGGLSLGAELAGVTVTHAYESNRSAAETFRHNHPLTCTHEEDLRYSTPPTTAKRKLTLLFGGPPCQGFSTSNQRTRNVENPRNWLFEEVLRFATALRPTWVIIENVKGIRETAQGHFESLITGGLENAGYSPSVWTLCAADYGVPQIRYRVFIVGSLTGLSLAPPPPTVRKHRTVRAALADLPSLAPGANTDTLAYGPMAPSRYAASLRGRMRQCTGHLVTTNSKLILERYSHIPPGGNWTSIPKRLMNNYKNISSKRCCHSGIYRRLHSDLPSAVIANYRKNMLIHPFENRGLSVREAARLQSFPDSFNFKGSIGFQQQQVSNAVPPLLAKAVFQHILNHS